MRRDKHKAANQADMLKEAFAACNRAGSDIVQKLLATIMATAGRTPKPPTTNHASTDYS
jgi:hypothetical protein